MFWPTWPTTEKSTRCSAVSLTQTRLSEPYDEEDPLAHIMRV